jgi:transcriptional regulator of arginine metabolism
MNKTYRQGQILNLIRSRPVHTQEELARELQQQYGIPATQVTLSRDIRDLGLIKTPDGYRQVAAAPPGPEFEAVVANFLRDVRQAQNLLVLRTSPGNANTLAIALDQENLPEVVGTIAGDDTVLVIAPDNNTAQMLSERLINLVRLTE